MKSCILSTSAFLAIFGACSAFAAEPAERYQKAMDRLVDAYNREDYVGMNRDFSEVLAEALPMEKFEPLMKGMAAQLGKIVKTDAPRITPPNEAVFLTQFDNGSLSVKFWLDDQDKLTGILFLAATPAIPVPEKHKTVLRLPFEGEWKVVWGGDNKELNRHHDAQNQRYAFDFVIVDDQQKSYRGSGNENEDYFAFGAKVFAPADGVVTDVIDGVRDNAPRSMNPYSALGNAVIIEHRDHEVSVFAHFKNGSIRVKPGDKVKKGHFLGLCGNSGNSSEPHIHYHLQNTPILQDGTGIKCHFENVAVTDGDKSETRKHYSPVKGEIIGPKKK
jgi:murein DD-endopeptidase MepM/ murein hydrolase activator NlpD